VMQSKFIYCYDDKDQRLLLFLLVVLDDVLENVEDCCLFSMPDVLRPPLLLSLSLIPPKTLPS
jgi:hypothetical protein